MPHKRIEQTSFWDQFDVWGIEISWGIIIIAVGIVTVSVLLVMFITTAQAFLITPALMLFWYYIQRGFIGASTIAAILSLLVFVVTAELVFVLPAITLYFYFMDALLCAYLGSGSKRSYPAVFRPRGQKVVHTEK